jgi:hypothetical protein
MGKPGGPVRLDADLFDLPGAGAYQLRRRREADLNHRQLYHASDVVMPDGMRQPARLVTGRAPGSSKASKRLSPCCSIKSRTCLMACRTSAAICDVVVKRHLLFQLGFHAVLVKLFKSEIDIPELLFTLLLFLRVTLNSEQIQLRTSKALRRRARSLAERFSGFSFPLIQFIR